MATVLGGSHVRDTDCLRIIRSTNPYSRHSFRHWLLPFWEPLMNHLLEAYYLWTTEEGLPYTWPDNLLLKEVQDMTSMQRAKALAWSVLLGPEPSIITEG